MRVKRMLKRGAVAAGRLLPREDPATRRVVLCYHSVHPTKRILSTTPELFEQHLQWITENCQLTTLPNLMSRSPARDAGKILAAITFDDGYEDNHSYALPILVKYRAPATFFVTAGLLERDAAVISRFEHLLGCSTEDVLPLDWAQVRELRACGMDVGSHTYSHPNLIRLSPSDVEDELRRSKDIVSNRLGAAVDLFAYPFGKPRVHFSSTTVELVRRTAYRAAAAVTFRGVRGSDSMFTIPRFFTDGDTISKLEAKIRGAYDLVGWWQEHVPVTALKIVSPLDFER